jgi:type IV secretory pathway TrbD component
MKHTTHMVYRSLTRPLLWMGVERKLLFFLVCISWGLFNLAGALHPAPILFAVLWTLARTATQKDPNFIRVLMNTRRFGALYDPAKRSRLDERGGA